MTLYREGTYYALPSHLTWERVAEARKRWDIKAMNAPVAMGPGVIAWGRLLYPLDYEVFFEDFGEGNMADGLCPICTPYFARCRCNELSGPCPAGQSELQEQVLGILEANSMPTEINDQVMALIQKGEEWLASRANCEEQLDLDPEERGMVGRGDRGAM